MDVGSKKRQLEDLKDDQKIDGLDLSVKRRRMEEGIESKMFSEEDLETCRIESLKVRNRTGERLNYHS